MLDNYNKDELGVIHQIMSKKYDYSNDYINNSYNSYGDLPKLISYLRLGNIIGSIGRYPNSLLDVGYGNGEFLKLCAEVILKCYGNDVSGYSIPNGCVFVDDIFQREYDVITFFDVLEHFEDINVVSKLKCNYVVISVPWCHYFSDEWFDTWKHRREDIHLHHFNDEALVKFMRFHKFKCVSLTNIEDIIRKSVDKSPNILTGTFKKNIKWKQIQETDKIY
jgi:SAM-dependent methyltransferase